MKRWRNIMYSSGKVFFEFSGTKVTSHKCCFSYNRPAFLDFMALKFTRHCRNLRLQSYRILYFRCQRKEKTWLWASVVLSSTMPSFLNLFSSVFFSSLTHFFLLSNFLFYLLFFFFGPHPLLFPPIPLILFNQVDPFLCLPSSLLLSSPPLYPSSVCF